MIKSAKIFGKTLDLNALEALQALEAGVSEGILTNLSFMEVDGTNIFGRHLHLFHSSSLAALSGLTATGLRGAAFLHSAAFEASLPRIASMARERLATVVHCIPQNGFREHYFPEAGYFHLSSSSAQEAVDFSIIAHKIAEQSLTPGLHVLNAPTTPEMIDFPDLDTLRRYLGQPDDQISAPSPAQQMLFGSHRRRIPNWFNFDHPTLHATRKAGLAQDLEAAASQEYFYRHLPGIIDQAFSEFADLTGWRYRAVQTHRIETANFLILAMGPIYPEVVKAVDRLQDEKKASVACLRLNVVQPFPKAELARLLKGRKGVTILEPIAGQATEESTLYTTVHSLLDQTNRNIPTLYHGQYGENYSEETIELVFKNMMKSGAQKRRYYLDIHFTSSHTSSPTHEVLLQNIRRDYPDIEAKTLEGRTTDDPKKVQNRPVKLVDLDLPLAIRRYEDKGPPYSRLSRFYHDTAHFYETNEQQTLVADPFQALPLTPPATAAFSGIAARREVLPVFHPEKCTACGACFVECPHAAIPPIALGAAALVKGAMQIAAQRGTPVSKLTPLVRNLGKIAGTLIKQKADSIQKVSDFLPEVFAKLLQQASADEEKKKILQEEFSIIGEIIGTFPVAVTDVFFKQPEKQQAGSGELFSLAIDPHACTACGLCVEACEEDALQMWPQTAEQLAQTQAIFQCWEQLPDTAGATISRLQQEETYNPFAATLLSRNFYLSMNGAEPVNDGASTKTLLHLITALTESIVQPQMGKQLNAIEKLTVDLATNINKLLTKALPSNDFDSIAAALLKTETPRLPLDELIGKLDAEEHLDLLDTTTLQRKIELYNDLKHLYETLKAGPTGAGRARYGLMLALDDFPWIESFPANSFTTPTILQMGGGSPERMLGLLQGHLRHLLDNLRLLRRAQLEIRNKYQPGQHDTEIAALSWEDLEDNEKELIPPVLLIGTYQQLVGANYASLLKLLTEGWPVKVFLLNSGPFAGSSGEQMPAALNCGHLLSVLTTREVFVLQSGMADYRHLFNGLLKGMLSPRPALFHLFTVDDRLQDVDAQKGTTLHQLALQTRIFPFFRFDPDAEGEFLSMAIKLDGNPAPEADWTTIQVEYMLEGEVQKRNDQSTPADWLYTRKDWRKYFEPYQPEAGEPVPVAVYLTLEKRARAGKVPVVFVVDEDRRLTQIQVAAPVVAASQAAWQYWNSLREIAGQRTPYPQKAREETEAELKGKYEAQIAQLQTQYEEKLQKQEAELMQQVKIRLREKLLLMSRKTGGQV